jgi:hypothetical protein
MPKRSTHTRMPSLTTDGYALSGEKIARIEQGNLALDRLRGMRRHSVAIAERSGLATWALDSYLQLVLHRIVSLAEGMASEWNSKRVVNSAILTRSLIESVSSWWHLLDHAEKLLDKEDLRGAHMLTVKATFGVRYGEAGDAELPTATNVLTLVQCLEKAFPKVMHFYDAISEMVHPNYDGVFLFGDVSKDREVVLDEYHAVKEDVATGKILFGLLMFQIFEASCSIYRDRIRPKVVGLEAKFGPNPSGWPGRPDPELGGQ